MTDETPDDFDPVTLEVYDLFRRQPGDAFTVEAISTQIGSDADEVAAALHELLEKDLIIEKGITDTTYRLSDGAPEL